MERYNEQPYASIADEFGEETAGRIAALVGQLDGEQLNYQDFPMVEFFAAALEEFPGGTELQVRRLGGYKSEQFGLEPEGLPVLSG
jgi:hypothetical protein